MFKKQVLTVVAFTLAMSTSAFARWTAIAYDSNTHKWGRAQCMLTEDEALNAAVSYCGDAGCKVVAYSRDGWVSLATGGSVFATGDLHDDQADAEASSLSRCRQRDPNCEVKVDGYALNCE